LEQRFDIIVPAPLHWVRWLQRGFNQSHLLARELRRRLRIPVVNALRRRKMTRAQAGLTRAGRRVNVAGAFSARRTSAVRDRRVLLVDDVMTTGATMNACAGALKRAGAGHITVLTLARADRRSPFPAVDAAALVEAGGAI
jgi:ComF family protein